jgi:hypothetical protein
VWVDSALSPALEALAECVDPLPADLTGPNANELVEFGAARGLNPCRKRLASFVELTGGTCQQLPRPAHPQE